MPERRSSVPSSTTSFRAGSHAWASRPKRRSRHWPRFSHTKGPSPVVAAIEELMREALRVLVPSWRHDATFQKRSRRENRVRGSGRKNLDPPNVRGGVRARQSLGSRARRQLPASEAQSIMGMAWPSPSLHSCASTSSLRLRWYLATERRVARARVRAFMFLLSSHRRPRACVRGDCRLVRPGRARPATCTISPIAAFFAPRSS